MLELPSIITAFIALFVVMDPFSSVPVFLSLTKNSSPIKREEAARVALISATGVLFSFLFGGQLALSLLGIRMDSFQIGGGIIMLLISISFAMGINYGSSRKTPLEAVLIGVPLLSGPGTMLTVVLLSNTVGILNVAVASALTLACSYLILHFSQHIYRLAGKNGLEILTRVMGVLLAGFAVEFIRRGLGV